MFVRIDFFDSDGGVHDYAWEGEMDVLPMVGHEISLPGNGAEMPLRASWNNAKTAGRAKVFNVLWYLDREDGLEVAVFSSMVWE